METHNWKELYADLRERSPELAHRVCRRLLVEMHRSGVASLDDLDSELTAALRLGQKRNQLDPNRPKPKLPAGAAQALEDLALRRAERHLKPEEIGAAILLSEKRQLAFEGSRLAEAADTPLDVLRDKISEFLDFAPEELAIAREDIIGTRAALVRRLLTDQLDFIAVAKKYIRVSHFRTVMEHLIPTEGNQGRLGGKAAGLILAGAVLDKAREDGKFSGDYCLPTSYYIPSSGILEFIEYNGLEELINIKYKPIEDVHEEYPLVERLFKSGHLPPTISDGLRLMLEKIGEKPLVVRSSSLLEDRIGHAFSGKYKSLFIVNHGPLEDRLAELEDAIAEVYASVFHPDPIEYRRDRGLIDFQEQMGILIQVVVGTEINGLLFPAFAGVAFSRCEMRWSSRIQRTDGIARLVLGLGTRAVDRTGDDYPVLVALEQPSLRAMQQPLDIYRYSQHHVDVVDLEEGHFETLHIGEFLSRVGRKLPMMNRLFSLYQNEQILPLIGILTRFDPEELVVTFDGQLRSSFPKDLKQILDLLENGLGEPVDVEFAHDGTCFYLLQCRALSLASSSQRVAVPSNILSNDQIFSARRHVQMAQLENLEYVVIVDPRDYEKLETKDKMKRVAKAIGSINRKIPEKSFILIGPGRWGSRGDIRLGVPVSYADISRTAMLVEVARQKGSYLPDVSFGTHFFNDLVEAKIVYLPLYPDEEDIVWNEDFLNNSPNSLAEIAPKYADMSEVVRVIHVPSVADGRFLQIIMDGDEDFAMAFLSEKQ